MKRLAFVIAIALFIAGCSAQQSTGIPENTQENHRLYRSFEEIVASHEAPQYIHPHHYGSFNEVVHGSGGIRFRVVPTLEGLEGFAPNIVRGRVMDDAEIFSRVNLVSLEILEVIQGNLTVGETIRIVEQYFIYDGVLFAHSDYLPSIPYQEYIFFLEPQIPGRAEELADAFWVADDDRGRYPIPGGLGRASIVQYLGEDGTFCATTQNFNSAIFGLGSHADVDIYMQLWEDVMNAYVLPGLPDLTGITLRPAEAVLNIDDTVEITAFVLPIGSAVTWATSNANVATVDSSGVVTAVSAGTATITATTADGEEATSEILVLGGGAGVLPGDVNGDGVVDFLDLLVLIYYLDNNGNISPDVTFVRENADLNGDGVICDLDLEILMIFLDVLGDR